MLVCYSFFLASKKIIFSLALKTEVVTEQLTIFEFGIFQGITPKEISHQAWNKNGGKEAPGILQIIQQFNEITYWVATEVVSEKDFKRRVSIITHFINIAEHCKNILNFNTMMEILVGLMLGPVQRLKSTWESVPSSVISTYKKLSSLIDNRKNYFNYRDALKIAKKSRIETLPIFPYVGLYLKDLTFIEDGNDNFTDKENKFINFEKMAMIANIFVEFQTYQENIYLFEPLPLALNWLKNQKNIIKDDILLFSLSKDCEKNK